MNTSIEGVSKIPDPKEQATGEDSGSTKLSLRTCTIKLKGNWNLADSNNCILVFIPIQTTNQNVPERKPPKTGNSPFSFVCYYTQ